MNPGAGLPACIEHTLLRPDATQAEVERALEDATKWKCHAVCVQPFWVPTLADHADSDLPIVTVAGFPFGTIPGPAKAQAAASACDDGAAEIDMVINLGALKSGDWNTIRREIIAVRSCTPGTLKVILETGYLTDAERDRAARLSMDEGVDFLKTCTGYGPRGATVDDVRALARFGPVKASAGIRTREQAEAMVAAGASRLGTSSTAAILGVDA